MRPQPRKEIPMRYRIITISLSVILAALILPVSIADTLVQETPPGFPAVGETFIFGRYEQDNDPNNGMEPIEWRVLAIEDNAALLISEYNLDAMAYDEKTYNSAITWEACSLRRWLNDNFLSTAFTKEEQGSILLSAIKNENNSYYGTDGGSDTEDRIFLLSIAETEKYFPVYGAGKAISTAYARAHGAYIVDASGTTGWWLRSPGFHTDSVAAMTPGGQLGYIGFFAWAPNVALRPALRLDLKTIR